MGLIVANPWPAHAYIGPAAGFAFLSSFFVFFVTVVAAVLSVVVWPCRMVWRVIRLRPRVDPLITRLIIVGFDGQDPVLTERYLAAGKLPNFRRLSALGGYRRLRTTF